MTLTDIGTMILAIATTASLLYISRQVRVTRQQARGQFLLALDAQFERVNAITVRLINETEFKPAGDDWYDIWRLMSVFERINIMVEDKILDIPIVDRLHGFRLLSILANDDIFHRVQAMGSEWQDFIDLCYAIADHRQRNGVAERDKVFIERVHQLSKEINPAKNPWRF
jgi:hypothetical protein